MINYRTAYDEQGGKLMLYICASAPACMMFYIYHVIEFTPGPGPSIVCWYPKAPASQPFDFPFPLRSQIQLNTLKKVSACKLVKEMCAPTPTRTPTLQRTAQHIEYQRAASAPSGRVLTYIYNFKSLNICWLCFVLFCFVFCLCKKGIFWKHEPKLGEKSCFWILGLVFKCITYTYIYIYTLNLLLAGSLNLFC